MYAQNEFVTLTHYCEAAAKARIPFLYVFIYGLFDDAVSISDYLASNDEIMKNWLEKTSNSVLLDVTTWAANNCLKLKTRHRSELSNIYFVLARWKRKSELQNNHYEDVATERLRPHHHFTADKL
jgi:hypothetical protein